MFIIIYVQDTQVLQIWQAVFVHINTLIQTTGCQKEYSGFKSSTEYNINDQTTNTTANKIVLVVHFFCDVVFNDLDICSITDWDCTFSIKQSRPKRCVKKLVQCIKGVQYICNNVEMSGTLAEIGSLRFNITLKLLFVSLMQMEVFIVQTMQSLVSRRLRLCRRGGIRKYKTSNRILPEYKYFTNKCTDCYSSSNLVIQLHASFL